MEPNYKSFVSWKQSKKGASYIQNKDMRDIARIQTQNQAPKSDMPHKNQNTFQSQINRQGMEEQEPIPPQKIYFQIISKYVFIVMTLMHSLYSFFITLVIKMMSINRL